MASSKAQTIYLKDYTPTPFLVKSIHMHFDLHDDHTVVTSTIAFVRNPESSDSTSGLFLNGDDLQLNRIAMDGKSLASADYDATDAGLEIFDVPDAFTLETEVTIHPENNKQLSGLYLSNGNFCTQCEPEGFRRITYFYDRPDVMTLFTTTITADKTKFPMLLANGNLIESRDLSDGRHWVKWEDPSLKPCYLFALVAGDFDLIEDTFTTADGRAVALKFYVERGCADRAHYALESLERAMNWDEHAFGCVYDLDIYMVVAVSDFNMGAMENKGLNIFNTKYVLADAKTATDQDFMNVERVIGHEYFHNWSGNRITCRDWFQITLKEGLTVLREQLFCEDMTGHARVRIQSANTIRNAQFAEDAGPMSHPIRPESYMEINNFYTVTVYEKGSEVIRMVRTFLGEAAFRDAMELYFSRFDGQAVTTEDFLAAMSESSGMDLEQFKRWYCQAGTPTVSVYSDYDASSKQLTLTLEQSIIDTDDLERAPLMMPINISLMDNQGNPILPAWQGDDVQLSEFDVTTLTLNFHKTEQIFTFDHIPSEPMISFLRDFSAPVKVDFPRSESDLLFLMRHDTDAFARWDAAQSLYLTKLQQAVVAASSEADALFDNHFKDAIASILSSETDHAMKALLLTLPSTDYLLQNMTQKNCLAAHEAREALKTAIAHAFKDAMHQQYTALYQGTYHLDLEQIGQRDLKNRLLDYLVATKDPAMRQLALNQLKQADNLTDRMGALIALNQYASEERTEALAYFYAIAKEDALMLDKWFALEASLPAAETLQRIETLHDSDDFDLFNPNRARALLGAFAANHVCFHQPNGEGYRFLADQVLALDPHNRQVAARLCTPLIRFKGFSHEQQHLMREQLERIKNTPDLSKDTLEIVTKALAH